MGINSVGDAADKELDMQLRKLATAMLVMGMTAGLAQAEDAAPAAGQTTYGWHASGNVVRLQP